MRKRKTEGGTDDDPDDAIMPTTSFLFAPPPAPPPPHEEKMRRRSWRLGKNKGGEGRRKRRRGLDPAFGCSGGVRRSRLNQLSFSPTTRAYALRIEVIATEIPGIKGPGGRTKGISRITDSSSVSSNSTNMNKFIVSSTRQQLKTAQQIPINNNLI